ncbi:MAG: UbiX family flavin prenyltransferase [Candidatus Heimdallarchaeota archaeon]|nr:UbiX family flavin prenyltransferase [Candidatus Heimdallarchaeota archaeon]MDH5646891.1 UbiX family flavin prenyltransferase [Candidatus Heimdallarchaeota archaeon]
MRLILGITGASGVQYGLKTLETLISLGHEVDLVISDGARKVMEYEVSSDMSHIINSATKIHDIKNLASEIASGTHRNSGMIIIPCSMKTIAAIANGYSDNLIQRAADCTLKENRKLVIVFRETPLNLIHLKNLVTIKEAGGIIMPAAPGFYKKPQTIDDLVDFIVAKTLNIFDINQSLMKPWNPKD